MNQKMAHLPPRAIFRPSSKNLRGTRTSPWLKQLNSQQQQQRRRTAERRLQDVSQKK